MADVDNDQEGRPAFLGRQGACVALGLTTGALQGVVEALGGSAEFDLLGLQHEVAALEAVDATRRFAAVAVAEGDAALEDVGVVARVLARRVGRGYAEQVAEVGDEELVVSKFGAVGVLPAGEEVLRGERSGHLAAGPQAAIPALRYARKTGYSGRTVGFVPHAARPAVLFTRTMLGIMPCGTVGDFGIDQGMRTSKEWMGCVMLPNAEIET